MLRLRFVSVTIGIFPRINTWSEQRQSTDNESNALSLKPGRITDFAGDATGAIAGSAANAGGAMLTMARSCSIPP